MRGIDKRKNNMKALTWKPILQNLCEANGELKELHCYLHYLEFGDVPENYDNSDKEWLEGQEKTNPFTESSLYVSLDHAYHHLNWAWNIRRSLEERVWKCADKDNKRWSKFPKTMQFADLWPLKDVIKGCDRKSRHRKVSITPVRVHILMAQRKLDILCTLVAKEITGNVSQGSTQADLNTDNSVQPLTEKEFARRMHRIFEELNMAWNSRKDTTFATTKSAVARRRLFPSIFATGCHNMWRKKMKLSKLWY